MNAAPRTTNGQRPLDRRLAALISCCCLFVLLSSFPFQTYVMPHLNDDHLPLAERIRSEKFGDSYGYGRYAEGILKHGRLSGFEGTPILKHMPALPMFLAVIFKTFGSVRPFLVFQILFFFLSLYFFLARAKEGFPAVAVMATPVIIALHPSTIKHSAGVMSDLLFGSMLLWVAFLLWNRKPSFREFFRVGVMFGLGVYVRESAFPFMVMTGLAYVLKDPRRYLGPTGLMVCTFLLLLSPWTIRNYLLTHEFTPLTTKSVDLFYYSSIPLTTKLYTPFGAGFQGEGYNYSKLYEVYDQEARGWARGRTDPGLNASSQSSSLQQTEQAQTLKDLYNSWRDRPLPASPIKEGLRNYLSRPKEQIFSLLLKTIALFNKPAILAHLAQTSFWSLLVAANVVFYAFHIGTILLGVVLSYTTRHNPFVFLPFWITAQYFQSLIFWSEERYLMPFYPFLILIALCWYWNRWKIRVGASSMSPSLR